MRVDECPVRPVEARVGAVVLSEPRPTHAQIHKTPRLPVSFYIINHNATTVSTWRMPRLASLASIRTGRLQRPPGFLTIRTP